MEKRIESEKMHKKPFLLPLFFASAAACAMPQAASEEAEAPAKPEAVDKEADPCGNEKGPCCSLDWTGQGATIVKIQGEALVSQSPWVNATLGMRVNNGGRVLTLDGSTAICAFDDGCWHVLKENEMLIIGDVSPCCAAAIPAAAPVPPVPPPALPITGLTWLLPVLPTAAIGACAATDCVGDSDEPDPPRPPISP